MVTSHNRNNRVWKRPIGRVWIAVCAAAGLTASGAGPARAQSLSLPKLDSVNFYLQAGSLVGSHDLVDDPSANEKMFGELGWGFETLFDMATIGKWDLELAVGYDQMFLRSKFVNKYNLRGTLKNFPSFSIYASHENGLYAGFGTGVVTLSNVSAFSDGHRAFSIAGDTFDLTGRLGFVKGLGDSDSTKAPASSLFVELAYHARFLGGASYGAGAPDTLPGSFFFGGVVVSVGAQIWLKPSVSSYDEDVKKEVKRIKEKVAEASFQPLTTSTDCVGAQLKPNQVPIDDYWDPMRCGSPDTVKMNVWVLADLPKDSAKPAELPKDSAKPPTVLEVCSYATLPTGWKIVLERWDPTRCGHPKSPEMNVKRIRKEGTDAARSAPVTL